MLFIILPISMAVVFLMWTFSIRLAAFLIGNFGHFPTTIFGSGNRSWMDIYIYWCYIDVTLDIVNSWWYWWCWWYWWYWQYLMSERKGQIQHDMARHKLFMIPPISPLRSAPLCTPTSPPTTRCFSKGFPARCTNWRKKSSAGLVLMMEIQMVLPPKTKIQIYLLDYSSM